jgi:hypothetical protein
MPVISTTRRLLLACSSAATLCLAGAAAAPAAGAAALLPTKSCPPSTVSQPFSPWGDQSSYELAPGGDFENSAWTLQDGAATVAGSEPWAVTGTLGSSSLSLPAGSSAVSPAFCVDAGKPTLRFFVSDPGTVLVQVVDGPVTIPVGLVTSGASWSPSPIEFTASAVLGILGDGTAQISVRLTGLTGHPRVDDVFIDPWNRG